MASKDKIRRSTATRLTFIREIEQLESLGKDSMANKSLQLRFKIGCESLEEIVRGFDTAHFDLAGLCDADSDDLKEHLEIRKDFREKYYLIKEYESKLFDSENINLKSETSIKSTQRNIKLSKIEVPKFSGDYKKFITYIDTFKSLVHNNNALSDIEKFNHLINSLTGPPLTLVQCTPLSSDNYNIAYNALVKRYHNKRLIANAHLEEIYNAPRISENRATAQNLRKLLDTFTENIAALKNMQYPVEHWDFLLLFLLNKCLDVGTVTRFELESGLDNNTDPKFTTLESFILKQCNALDAVACSTQRKMLKSLDSPFSNKPKPSSSFMIHTQKTVCAFCNSTSHSIYSCSQFLSKSPHQRYDHVKAQKWCLNCLGHKHIARDCTSTSSCRICGKRHHSLLHFDLENSNSSPSENNAQIVSSLPNTQNTSKVAHTLSNFLISGSTVLLSTAVVRVKDIHGSLKNIRVLLDSASQASFMSLKCHQQLGLPKSSTSLSICGLGDTVSSGLFGVACEVCPRDQGSPIFPLEAVVVPKICSAMPSAQLCTNNWRHIVNLKLADPNFDEPGDIDMLLGADIFPLILQPGRIKGKAHQPTALNTSFGWILMGKVNVANSPTVNSFLTLLDSSLDNTLKKFWEIEEIPNKSLASPDDVQCEQIFKSTFFRQESGRFVVTLPFKNSEPIFCGSRTLAQKRFFSLERRLLCNPLLYREYSKFMKEYLDFGFMSLVNSPPSLNSYYIPHHCIFKPDSSSTPIRVVFDASAKDVNGKSLNDALLAGPKLQQSIFSILLDFRTHSIVFCTDIKKMFLQILINEKHRNYQRILWRFSPSEPVQDFTLNTVTFGVSSSPFLAIRTLLQLAEENRSSFPRAAKLLETATYVDDIIGGCDHLDEALLTQKELIELLKHAGFELRKWVSNSSSFLKALPEDHLHPQALSLDLDSDGTVKILGLRWLPTHDLFSYVVQHQDKPCTKRNILSELARIFDPLGFLTPLTLFAKYLIQHLWTIGLDWDEVPPVEILRKWTRYKNELPLLSELKIPRRITRDNCLRCEIHGFADASEKGYGCVVYLRVISLDSSNVSLIAGKSKVSPLKKLSIPRLELCGALLLSDLLESVMLTYKNLNIERVFAWTDSTVALSWIQSSPHRWKTFVANRVLHIQEKVAPDHWYHVSTKNNPADCASRGMLPAELVQHTQWWAGPEFLQTSEEINPQRVEYSLSPEGLLEEQRVSLPGVIFQESFDHLINKFSSLDKIMRIVAYTQRFACHCRDPLKRSSNSFSQSDLHKALMALVKITQTRYFAHEISLVAQKKLLPKSLRKLSLFIDENGILRVGGRLRHSQLSYDSKFPALLPSSSRLTELIIVSTHERHLHPGFQTLHFLLTQSFWILSAKRTIRKVLSRCLKCWKINPKTCQPPMGDLPAVRVSQVKAFSLVGTDYAGPFTITLSRLRGAKSLKAYICLFVCYVTKALHLELASDLSTEAFLAAFRRFIARRGRCSKVFSDCGTNFVGAAAHIRDLFKESAETESIEWVFNPPSAPHFGGLWEAGVKSVKTHLHRVIGEQILTYEELYTLLTQIEAVLNSRPLCSVSSDPNDLAVLTPGHFLTLEPLTCLPEANLQSNKLGHLSRWQLIQRLHQDFWTRWHREYLHTLQQRGKWLDPSTTIAVGSVVLIKNELTSPLRWILGRVEKTYPGADGVLRVVDVRTSKGVLKRPLTKLCPLPNMEMA